MTQMSTSAARVVDPILSTIAQGYKNAEFVGSYLFPKVPVGMRAGKIIQFGKESFMAYDTARAPGSSAKRLSIGYGNTPYSIVDHTLDAIVPRELLEEAQVVPGINLSSASIMTVMNAMALRLEIEQATLAVNASNYGASNKITLSGTAQWSDLTTGVSDPVSVIETAKEAVRQSIGKRPNVIVMGAQVFKSLKQHPKIIDRLKYTSREIATPEILASLFDVSAVYVGDAIQSDNVGTFSDVWGKSVVLAYTEASGIADYGRPTFGYTYQLAGYPFVEQARWDGDTRSWVYGVADAARAAIVGANAGYLISAAVA